MRKGKLIVSFLIILFLISIAIKPTMAFGGDIIQDDKTTVAANQTVDNVVVFGSDAVIKGAVRGSVIVIDGDLHIEKTAKIHEVVLDIGGKITQEKGAQVKDEVIDITFGNGASLGFIVAAILLLTSWGLRLGFSLLFIIVVILTLLIMKDKTRVLSEIVREKPVRTLIVGAVSSVLAIAVGILLCLTIIGIPVALLLFILWLIFFFITLTVVSKMIGYVFKGHEDRKPWLNGFYGALVLVGFINLPFLGCLLVLGLVWLSTAYMVLWLFRKIRFKA